MLTTITIPIDPKTAMIVATGGVGRERQEYRDGQATGESLRRNGAAVWRLTGVAVSVAGQGLDGATVETATPLDEVPAGTIFAASGACELTVRATATAGFGANASPRGQLAVTVWVETLTSIASVDDLIAGGRRAATKAGVATDKAAS